MAYTHLWAGKTVVIDVKTHSPIARWSNGCRSSRGIAIDVSRGFLFAGCAEGKAVVLDLTRDGQPLASVETGSGVDVIGYNATLSHLYVPGAASGTMAILAVSNEGKLSSLETVKTVSGAHCAVGDDQNNIWVCDPMHGMLWLYQDLFAPSQ